MCENERCLYPIFSSKSAPPALQFHEWLAIHFAFFEYDDNRYFLSYVVKNWQCAIQNNGTIILKKN
jgi:hypothetical protein